MRGSTFVPWLLMGPIAIAMVSMLSWYASGVPLFASVAQVAVAVALGVIVTAFVASWRSRSRIDRDASER